MYWICIFTKKTVLGGKMDGKQYLNNIRAEEMTKEELQKEIKKLYEDNWAISNQCEKLEMMLNERFKKEVNYEKEFAREWVIRKYANSEGYNYNIKKNIYDLESNIICSLYYDYLPEDADRIIAEIKADWELLPKYQKIKAYIGCWLDDCVEYLRGIWGINKGY
jgi:Txe/YoeB family toxin of Txe-Axe toxin-antitoxin module